MPNSIRLNRGRTSLKEVFQKASRLGASKVLVLFTRKGNPSVLFLFTASGELLQFLMISGVKLSVDMKVTRQEIESKLRNVNTYCLAESDCPLISQFLINLGYKLGDNCDVIARAKAESDICVVNFFHKGSILIPPEIRFLNDKGNTEIYKWGVSLISEVVKG